MKYFEDISLNLLEIFQKSQTGKGFIKSHDDSALRVLIENLTQIRRDFEVVCLEGKPLFGEEIFH